MPTPTTNLGLSSIQTEFTGANPISISEYYRGGGTGYVPGIQPDIGYGLIAAAGTISMGTFRGTSRRFVFTPTIAASTTNYNLKAAAIAAGWNQVNPLYAIVTINSGVYVYATATNVYAFDTGVTFPAGTTLAIINNGLITGRGGNGGAGGYAANGGAGAQGGPALRAQFALTVTNNGTIGAGGGGGGGAGGYYDGKSHYQGGGGGGGRVLAAGGAGANNGGTATLTAAGAGGPNYGAGGNGGELGAAGGTGASPYYAGAGGGATHAYITGNGNVTWNVTGTRLGTVA
jgi:hypothetical protein